MKLAVIVPSRGRPQAMADLLATFEATCRADTRILCRVDYDDPHLEEYRQVMPYHCYAGPRIGLGASINELAQGFCHKYDVLGFMGDDHRPRTVGWDERILSAVALHPLSVVYGNDLLQGINLASQVFMDAQIVQRLGFFNPPGMRHMYIDNFWMTLGLGLGTLQYLEDVVIEHMHPLAQKAQWDVGYREVNSQQVYDADRQTFQRYLDDQFAADLKLLRAS